MNQKSPTVKIEVTSVTDEVAAAIKQLAEVGEALQAGKLKQKAIVLLLNDITKLPKTHITYVLNALPRLQEYIK
jgi:hypothetical protein